MVFSLFGMYTHFFAVIYFVSQLLMIGILKKFNKSVLKRLGVIVLLFGILSLPLLPMFVRGTNEMIEHNVDLDELGHRFIYKENPYDFYLANIDAFFQILIIEVVI